MTDVCRVEAQASTAAQNLDPAVEETFRAVVVGEVWSEAVEVQDPNPSRSPHLYHMSYQTGSGFCLWKLSFNGTLVRVWEAPDGFEPVWGELMLSLWAAAEHCYGSRRARIEVWRRYVRTKLRPSGLIGLLWPVLPNRARYSWLRHNNVPQWERPKGTHGVAVPSNLAYNLDAGGVPKWQFRQGFGNLAEIATPSARLYEEYMSHLTSLLDPASLQIRLPATVAKKLSAIAAVEGARALRAVRNVDPNTVVPPVGGDAVIPGNSVE